MLKQIVCDTHHKCILLHLQMQNKDFCHCIDSHVTLTRVLRLRLDLRALRWKRQTWNQSRLWAVEHMVSWRECGIDLAIPLWQWRWLVLRRLTSIINRKNLADMWLGIWRSSNSNLTMFELRMCSTDSKFDKCFKCLAVECEFVEKSLSCDWFHTVCTDSQRAQTDVFFLKFNLSHKLQLLNVQHNFCSVMCYIVLMWTQILSTLGNNIVTLLFNWP